jgi:hypothetical protein
MCFQIPQTWSARSETFIEVEGLSEHVYPAIYIKRIELDSEPEDVETLSYPSIVDYDE